MKKVKAVEAPKPRSEMAKIAAWVYAAILVAMALGQLYAFEKFIPLIEEYSLPGGDAMAGVVAALIVTVEVFALPFLLRMRISPLLRWVSLVCSAAAAGAWVKLSLWVYCSMIVIPNSGMLGTKVTVPMGIVSLGISFVLLALALYCVWGLWPVKSHRHKS